MKKIILSLLVIAVLAVPALAAAPKYHTIQAGDTLHSLAQKYDTTVVQFLDFNPGLTPDNLRVGDELLIPVEPLWSYHVVQPGDNAKSLAMQYKVPEDLLKAANDLTTNKLTVGEMIRIPIHFYLGDANEQQTHQVEIGDTLYKIAQKYNVTLSELLEWNNIEDLDQIFAGQILIVG